MSFDDLKILHIYSYSKPKGKESCLKIFNKQVNPLGVSTCMRHLYIFSNTQLAEKQEHLDNLLDELKNPGKHQASSKFEMLEGRQAYILLLYWVVGGLNKKKPFNDIRILGNLRKSLHKAEHSISNSNRAAWLHNKDIAISLRIDSKRLLNWVRQLPGDIELDDKQNLIMTACKNCTWAREQSFLNLFIEFDYSFFSNKNLLMEYIVEKFELLKNKTNQEILKIHDSLGDVGFLFSQSKIHLQARLDIIELHQQSLQADNMKLAII